MRCEEPGDPVVTPRRELHARVALRYRDDPGRDRVEPSAQASGEEDREDGGREGREAETQPQDRQELLVDRVEDVQARARGDDPGDPARPVEDRGRARRVAVHVTDDDRPRVRGGQAGRPDGRGRVGIARDREDPVREMDRHRESRQLGRVDREPPVQAPCGRDRGPAVPRGLCAGARPVAEVDPPNRHHVDARRQCRDARADLVGDTGVGGEGGARDRGERGAVRTGARRREIRRAREDGDAVGRAAVHEEPRYVGLEALTVQPVDEVGDGLPGRVRRRRRRQPPVELVDEGPDARDRVRGPLRRFSAHGRREPREGDEGEDAQGDECDEKEREKELAVEGQPEHARATPAPLRRPGRDGIRRPARSPGTAGGRDPARSSGAGGGRSPTRTQGRRRPRHPRRARGAAPC